MLGFPYPENVSLAKSLESIVRRNGAVPATIGIFNGVAKIGLSSEELNKLVSSSYRGQSVLKVSRRDLGYICGLVSGRVRLSINDHNLTYQGNAWKSS